MDAEETPKATLARALELHRAGALDASIVLYRALAQQCANPIQVHFLLGSALVQNGQAQEGVDILDALARTAEPWEALLNNLATGWIALNRPEQALSCYDRLCALYPDVADLHVRRARLLGDIGRLADAAEAYGQAFALRPQHAQTACDLAYLLVTLNRPAEALTVLEAGLAHTPDFAPALRLRAELTGPDDPDRAIADLQAALRIEPEHIDARLHLGEMELLCGTFESGWQNYEARWQQARMRDRVPHFSQPPWRGTPSIADKAILLFAEQGFGDMIHFARYAPLVARLAAKTILAVPANLIATMRTLRGGDAIDVVDMKAPLPPFDTHCPLMSLPLCFRTTLADIPADIPYLSADDAHKRAWQARLGERRAPRIGLAVSGWAGAPFDADRSIALVDFAPLLAQAYEFHLLQKDIRDSDGETLHRFPQIHTYTEYLTDFADTAALIAEMDLVVSVDTAIAHLAGAMGKPVFLLPRPGDWRWLRNRADSPWYPTVRLFRQTSPGTWQDAIAAIATTASVQFSS